MSDQAEDRCDGEEEGRPKGEEECMFFVDEFAEFNLAMMEVDQEEEEEKSMSELLKEGFESKSPDERQEMSDLMGGHLRSTIEEEKIEIDGLHKMLGVEPSLNEESQN